MLNVGQLNEGFVLDHIEAGKSMMIYNKLGLDKLDCCVAIIKNARSNKMGKKDIIKIEADFYNNKKYSIFATLNTQARVAFSLLYINSL